MSRIHTPTSLCCLLQPHGKCSACKLKLCAECFQEHLQKNDLEAQLKFLDGEGQTYTYHTSLKCSLLGKPAIYVDIDTVLNL